MSKCANCEGKTTLSEIFPLACVQSIILYFFPLCTFTHFIENHSSCFEENAHTRRTFSFDFLENASPKRGSTIGSKRKLYGRAISHSPSISSTLYVVMVKRIIWATSSQEGSFLGRFNAPRTR